MNDEPVLTGLRQVSDETLYLRLLVHQRNAPTDGSAEDYYYRADLWEIVNKAIRKEVVRRKATPPRWWPARPPQPRQPRLNRHSITAAIMYLGVLAVIAAAATRLSR
jgi:hypothetical protein